MNLRLIRAGKQIELLVVLKSKSGESEIIADSAGGLFKLFGAELKEASKDKLTQLSLKHGVEVVAVANGKFKTTGIRKGFIITYINQTPVSKPSEIESIAQVSRRSLLIEGVYPDGTVVYYGMGL